MNENTPVVIDREPITEAEYDAMWADDDDWGGATPRYPDPSLEQFFE